MPELSLGYWGLRAMYVGMHQSDAQAETKGDGKDEAISAAEAIDGGDLDSTHTHRSEEEGGHAAEHTAGGKVLVSAVFWVSK